MTLKKKRLRQRRANKKVCIIQWCCIKVNIVEMGLKVCKILVALSSFTKIGNFSNGNLLDNISAAVAGVSRYLALIQNDESVLSPRCRTIRTNGCLWRYLLLMLLDIRKLMGSIRSTWPLNLARHLTLSRSQLWIFYVLIRGGFLHPAYQYIIVTSETVLHRCILD